jgi:hypothetical protein
MALERGHCHFLTNPSPLPFVSSFNAVNTHAEENTSVFV